MPAGRDTRQVILKAAYALFRRKGFTRVGVDEIAEAADVTKRTLYYHFKSKDDLFSAMFEQNHELAVAAFKTFGDKMKGNPDQIIDAMFDELAAWSSKPKWAGSGFTRIAAELADMPGHPARSIARKHKTILEKCLADMLKSAKVPLPDQRAREIFILSEGAISMILVTGDQKYAASAAEAAKRLIRAK